MEEELEEMTKLRRQSRKLSRFAEQNRRMARARSLAFGRAARERESKSVASEVEISSCHL